MEDIKLSVVITNYNQIEYIETAVNSILNQDIGYTFEILLGDDGSSDGSYELIQRKYGADNRIKIFRMDRDPSIKEFSNWRHSRLIWFLLERTRGSYISVLDGDDYYCGRDGFNRKINILELEENSDCIACTSATMSDVAGSVEKVDYPKSINKLDIKDVFFAKNRYFFQIATCVFRREVLEHADFGLSELHGADQAILYFIMHYGKLYYTPEYDYVNRKLPNSIWHAGNDAEHCLRVTIGMNISRIMYKDFYFRRFWRDGNSILFVYENKKEIPNKLDWNMWKGFAEKYNLDIVKWLMGEKNVSAKVKVEMSISVFVLRVVKKTMAIFNYGRESIIFLCDRDVGLEEKIKRIKRVMRMR